MIMEEIDPDVLKLHHSILDKRRHDFISGNVHPDYWKDRLKDLKE